MPHPLVINAFLPLLKKTKKGYFLADVMTMSKIDGLDEDIQGGYTFYDGYLIHLRLCCGT